MDAASRPPTREREEFLQRAYYQEPTLTQDIQELLDAAAQGLRPFRPGGLVPGASV